MREIQSVLFDLDGTLVDSRGAIGAALSHALERLGHSAPADFSVDDHIGMALLDIFRDAFGITGERAEQGIAHYREYYDREARHETRVYAQVASALAELTAHGRRLYVATVKPGPIAEKVLAEMGLADHFAGVAGSSMDHSRRSKADIIGHALREHGIDAAHAAMVGDRAQDITGARSHGLLAVGVTWGFGSAEELRAAAADHLVDCPSLIPSVLATVDRAG